MERQPCVYILASAKHGTLYIGVTSNLLGRLLQHREGVNDKFTSRHGVYRLVYFEMADTMEAAIVREKQLKKWNRDWKANLIERDNPHWDDLAIGLGLSPYGHSRESGTTRTRGGSEPSAIWIPACAGMTEEGRITIP